MIYFCADDYGLNDISSMRIKKCVDEGVLNKVSVFPNFCESHPEILSENKKVYLSLHINLVEGKCISAPSEIYLIADKDGKFRYTFNGLLKLDLFQRNKFREQIHREIKAQVLYWKEKFGENTKFMIDSHQHTHMIPGVFKELLRVIQEENIQLEYLRIPSEPVLPYIKQPSLYHTYTPINIIKQWLLKFLWMINKLRLGGKKIPTAYFFGILFSGKMDEKRVKKVLPHYVKLAEKNKKDIEVLFHPGYLEKDELADGNVVFDDFYLSRNRKTEFDAVMNI